MTTRPDLVTKVATANIKNHVVSNQDAEQAVRDLVDAGAHIIGLQEWGRDRLPILRRLEADGYGFAGNSRPVLYQRARFGLRTTTIAVLAPGGRVNPLPGRRSIADDTRARIVGLRCRETDEDVTVLNYHLIAAASRNGRPLPTPRGAKHAQAAARLAWLYDSHAHDGIVYALGDSNEEVRQARRAKDTRSLASQMYDAGAVSCWEGNMPHPRNGTYGRRIIDDIYSDDQAERVRQFPNPSDHDAVLATYRRPRP